MTWWFLVGGLVLGLIILGFSVAKVMRLLGPLRRARFVLEERMKAVQRLQSRLEAVQADVEALQAKLPQSGKLIPAHGGRQRGTFR